MAKSELQKLIDGEWYKVNDPEVASRKINSAAVSYTHLNCCKVLKIAFPCA